MSNSYVSNRPQPQTKRHRRRACVVVTSKFLSGRPEARCRLDLLKNKESNSYCLRIGVLP
jgi:hypothetical protein